MSDAVKRNDQIRMLEACLKFTDTGEFDGLFTYANCGWDLVQTGLATEDRKITPAGRAVLWFLNKGADPTSSRSFEQFSIPLRKLAVSESRPPRDGVGPGYDDWKTRTPEDDEQRWRRPRRRRPEDDK